MLDLSSRSLFLSNCCKCWEWVAIPGPKALDVGRRKQCFNRWARVAMSSAKFLNVHGWNGTLSISKIKKYESAKETIFFVIFFQVRWCYRRFSELIVNKSLNAKIKTNMSSRTKIWLKIVPKHQIIHTFVCII